MNLSPHLQWTSHADRAWIANCLLTTLLPILHQDLMFLQPHLCRNQGLWRIAPVEKWAALSANGVNKVEDPRQFTKKDLFDILNLRWKLNVIPWHRKRRRWSDQLFESNALDQTNRSNFHRFSARDQEMMWVIASLLRNHLANQGRRQEFWCCQVSTCASESMKEYERHNNPWFLKRKWNLTSESLFNLCRQHESSSCFTVILWILFLHFPAHQVLHVLILLHQHLSLQRPETEQLQQLNGAVTEVDWHHQRETK